MKILKNRTLKDEEEEDQEEGRSRPRNRRPGLSRQRRP